MAPRESLKATPKVQRTVSKTKAKASSIISTVMATKKLVDATQIQVNNTTMKTRASMAPPSKPKEPKPVPAPSSATKRLKKVRKPKAGHSSGVPVPSKLKVKK